MKQKFKRNVYSKVKKALENKQTAILFGLRRLGKTTILHQLREETKNSIYLDWSDFDNKSMTNTEFYNKLVDLAEKYYLLLFDEVQERDKWDEMLFSLWNKYVDSDKCRIVATGSSSLLIKPRELGLNRSKRIYINSFSFKEYCKFTEKKLTNENFEYFLGRGFPQFANYDFSNNGYSEVLEEVLKPIFNEDIPRFRPKLPSQKIINLLYYLGQYSMGEININKISQKLHIDNKAVSEYIDLLEKCNLLKRIYKINEKGKKAKYAKFKVYLNPHFYIWINKKEFSKIKRLHPEMVGHIIEAYWIHSDSQIISWSEYYYLQNEKDRQKEIDFVRLASFGDNIFDEIHEIKYQNKLKPSDTNLFMVTANKKFIWNKKSDFNSNEVNIKSLLEI